MDVIKTICFDCLHDSYLSKCVRDNPEFKACSYCGVESSVPIAWSIGDVIEVIKVGFDRYYEDPAESYPYEEGEYVGLDGSFIDEIMNQHLLEGENQKFIDDVIDIMDDGTEWARGRFALGNESDEYSWDWYSFKNEIKHENRFFYFLQRDRRNSKNDHVFDVFKFLEEAVLKYNLVKKMPAGTKFYRIRMADAIGKYSTAKELGTPPAKICRMSNRLSPPGIPLFYGANDLDTAINETYDPDKSGNKIAACGEFELVTDQYIVDFTEIPEALSIFDDSNDVSEYHQSLFINLMAIEISNPITRDDRIHVDYIPTQVIFEFLVNSVKIENGSQNQGIIGVAFGSSRDKDGKNYGLRILQEQCVDNVDGNSDPFRPPLLKLVNNYDIDLKDFVFTNKGNNRKQLNLIPTNK